VVDREGKGASAVELALRLFHFGGRRDVKKKVPGRVSDPAAVLVNEVDNTT